MANHLPFLRKANLSKTALILFFSLYATGINSQVNENRGRGYIKGFVITSSGDSIPGYINLPSWEGRFTSFSFKPKLNEARLTYDPYQVAAMGTIDGMFLFKSLEIPIYNKTELSFVRQLIQGQYSLYGYQILNFDHVLLEGSNRKIFDITNPPDTVKVRKNQVTTISRETFNRNLGIIFADDPEISMAIGTISPSRKSVIKALTKYYDQKGLPYELYGLKLLNFYFGIGGSASFERATFLMEDTKIKSDYSLVPNLGIVLGARNRISGFGMLFESSVGYRSVHYTYDETLPQLTFYFEGFQKDILLNSKLGLGYSPAFSNRVRPVFEAGGMAYVSLSNKCENYYDFLIPGENTVYSTSDNTVAISKNFYGGFIRAGAELGLSRNNLLMITAEYDPLWDFNGEVIHSVRIGVTYLFKKQ